MDVIFSDNDNCYLNICMFENTTLIDNVIEDIKDLLDEKPEIFIYGKLCHQQRDIGFFSDGSIGYHYFNQLARSKPLTENLYVLLDEINTKFNSQFNGILINRYNDGEDYISAHSDDEKGLDPIGVVALSYGAERTFRIRTKFDKKIKCDLITRSYQIIHMGGNQFQKTYTHEIPKTKKCKNVRYSLTFRKHMI